MAIKICVLGSGSKGNSVLLDNGKSRVLIDCGLTMPSLNKKITELGFVWRDIDGVLITHEHEDHIRSLQFLSQDVPVYTHESTMELIARANYIPLKNRMSFDGSPFSIGSFDITAFRISHDCAFPVGYSISDGETKFTYATDMGFCGRDFMKNAAGSDMVMIESNHDVDMLLKGRYPEFLKRRIISEKGHLSNKACTEAVCELAAAGTKRFILAHLSEENNVPELAYWTNKEGLKNMGAGDKDVRITVADQYRVSGWIQ